MSGIVSVDELKSYMSDITLSESQEAAVEEVLAGIQQDLEDHINRPLQPVQVREYIQTDSLGYANVRVSPVWKVIRRDQMDGMTSFLSYDLTTPYVPPVLERDPLIGEDGTVIDYWGVESWGAPIHVPGGIFIGVPDTWFAIEYVGGALGFMNQKVKLAIMRVAAREVTGLHDNTLSLRQGNAEPAADPDPRPKGWTDEELQRFERMRRRVII